MTSSQDTDDRLRAAFRSLSADGRTDCSKEELERVWRAVSGELPADERQEIVARMGTEPAVAEAWRIAHELRVAQQERLGTFVGGTARSWRPAWIGLAALLVLSVGAGLLQLRRSPTDTFRDPGRYVVEPLVISDAMLPRDRFVLRWKPGPDGSRYQVRVTTDDLRVLTTAADLTAPELTVPAERLSELAAGARVLWQIVVAFPGGETVSSETFVVRVQ